MSQSAVMYTRTLLAVVSLLCAGCASTPYTFVARPEHERTLALREGEAQVERGAPNAWVDGFGHYFFSLPSKLLLLSWKMNNHDVPPEVELALTRYLHANGLCNVKVRLNQYTPSGEWQRLRGNTEIPWGWRYTLGILGLAAYTILPERLFAGFPLIGGGDHYNPYTNTISIYSGIRPVALHEGGHAKDFSGIGSGGWKGAYAGFRAIPLIGLPWALWQEGKASNDALSWELAVAGSRESKAAYRMLYPAYGTYLGGTAETAASFFLGGWILYAIQYGTVVGGHVVGQTRAAFVREREAGIQPEVLTGLQAPAVLAAALQASAPKGGCAPEPVDSQQRVEEALGDAAPPAAEQQGGEQGDTGER